MTRRESRELAFQLLFERSFTEDSVGEIIEKAEEAREIKASAFTRTLAEGAQAHFEESDALIARCSQRWNAGRISRVAMAVLRLAVYEMRHVSETPVNIAINEAVELAKTYGGSDEAAFVNGVLGGITRAAEAPEAPAEAAVQPDAADR